MTNTVMFDLQAAAMAAAANGGLGGVMNGTGDIPEDGMSFSDVLASHTVQSGGTAAADEAAADAVLSTDSADIAAAADEGIFGEAMKLVDSSNDGVKKALKLLLKTVLNAMRGDSDNRKTAKKTDMFMLLSDTGAGFSGDDEDDFLLGAGIMDQIGLMIEAQTEISDKADDVLSGIEDILSEILGVKNDDEADENAMADALAALLNIQPEEAEEFSFASDDAKAEAVSEAAEAFKAPMEALKAEMPEKVPEAEKLYSDFEAEVKAEPQNEQIPEISVKVSFASFKINNAAGQVDSIGVKSVNSADAEESISAEAAGSETAPDTDYKTVRTEAESENVIDVKAAVGGTEAVPEAAAAGIQIENVGTEEIVTETELAPAEKTSVERQLTGTVDEEIRAFGDKDGTKELVLILRPKELGQIAVKLVKEGSAVSVVLSAQYEQVGKMMTERAAYLGSSLSNQDYEVKDVQIVEPGNAAEQMGLNFTDRGFSFAGNNSGQSENYRGSENDGYGEIDGIEEANADHGGIRLREARLWTTA